MTGIAGAVAQFRVGPSIWRAKIILTGLLKHFRAPCRLHTLTEEQLIYIYRRLTKSCRLLFYDPQSSGAQMGSKTEFRTPLANRTSGAAPEKTKRRDAFRNDFENRYSATRKVDGVLQGRRKSLESDACDPQNRFGYSPASIPKIVLGIRPPQSDHPWMWNHEQRQCIQRARCGYSEWNSAGYELTLHALLAWEESELTSLRISSAASFR